MTQLIEFFGRLHPLILHLPIGILAVAFAMEWMSRKEKYATLQLAVGFALQLGVASCFLAAVSGYILSYEGGYNETILFRHQWSGIATAVGTIVVYFLYRSRTTALGKKLYFPTFVGLMGLMGAAGHFGGSLTHGSEFLTEPFFADDSEQAVITNIDSAMVFNDLVQPILKQKCVSCHNESKIKGELLMSTIEGIKKGGETGAFFVAGSATNSLFLQRAYLPLEDKKHMPPKGKRQLTDDEIALLEWWVDQGAHFDKSVAEVEQPEHVQAILTKFKTAGSSVLALDVAPPDPAALNRLQQAGATVDIIAKNKPFIAVQVRGRQDLDKAFFKALQGVDEQVIALDLSNTNTTDALLSYLGELPHLQKLFLQKTQVTGAALNELQDLKHLEYLNLYDTPLTDVALEPLTAMKALKDLYLWETSMSTATIKQLRTARPNLHVNTGIDQTIFGKASLKPPLIIIEKDIFTDSVAVEFDLNIKNVDLFYTTDGSIPDSTSAKYTGVFYINKSTNVQVIAQKGGWETSEVAQKGAVRARYKIQAAKLDKQPNDRYKGNGGKSLIDFETGTLNFTEGEWIGYENEHFTATLDMGKNVDISNVSVSALESTGSYIFFPKNIAVATSTDGKNFQAVAQKVIPTTAGPEPPLLRNFILDFEPQAARYIKVELKSNLTNPAWHQAPGAPCWMFVDEILVD